MTGKGQELYATLKTALADYVFTEAYNAGATAFASGDYKTAITQLKKATEAKTDDFNAWYYLAFSYRNNNDTKKANKIFRQIVQQFPTQAATFIIFPATSQAILHRAKQYDKCYTGYDDRRNGHHKYSRNNRYHKCSRDNG